MSRVGHTRSSLGSDDLDTRQPHQPTQALAPQIPATVAQLQAQLALPVKRSAHVQRIQVLQDRQILTRWRLRPP
jgi:hypothetical protein